MNLVRRGLSGSRIRGVLNALRAVLRRPLQADELQADPTDRLDLPAGDRARERAASPGEAAALLDALPAEDRALWATAFYAGLRRGELRALRDDDVDLDANLIRVRCGWDEKEGAIEPKSEKGRRDVPIPGALRLILLEHRARTGRRGADLLFGRTAREPFTPSHIRRRAIGAWAAAAVGAFLRGRVEVELELIGLHEARHSYVSLMASLDVPLERIGDYVGPHLDVHDRPVPAPDRGTARAGRGGARRAAHYWGADWGAVGLVRTVLPKATRPGRRA